jgi:heat shock protein HtpX
MNQETAAKRKLRNWVHTLLLIGGMSLLLALCSALLFGEGVWIWVFCVVALLMLVLPDVSPHWILRFYQAQPLHPQASPQLTQLMWELAKRAELDRPPELFWIPSYTVNAFAVGERGNSAIAVTGGLLQLLSPREIAGVLAHEVSHIANNDLRLMGLADLISRLTHMMSALGLMLLFIYLPLMLLGVTSFSLLGMLLLLAAPSLSALLQLSLSRIREFDADLEAARITGDPDGLASALGKISRQRGNLWQRILFPGYQNPEPSLLRTHPDTDERIERLLELREAPARLGVPMIDYDITTVVLPDGYHVIRRPRQRYISGIWH